MHLVTVLLIGLGGGLGSVLRWGIDRAVSARVQGFPHGVMLINLSGSLLLGLLNGLAVGSGAGGEADWLLILGGGVLGGYTTFSTAMVDSVRLGEQRRVLPLVLNTIGMVVLALAAVLLGAWAASVLLG